jgi:hypothetical protein
MMDLKKHLLASSILASVGFLSACGSDSASTTDINGLVFASYVSGASVIVSDAAGNQVAGPVISDVDGRFSVVVPPVYLSEPLVFTATGGEYVDEATGESVASSTFSGMIAADSLDESGAVEISVTPSSSIIHDLVTNHGQTLAEAKVSFEAAFGYAPDATVLPVDATQSNADANEAQRLAGLRAAAFSRLTQDLGLDAVDQRALLRQLAADIADGDLDGMIDGMTEVMVNSVRLDADIQGKFSQALVDFKTSELNKTELNNDKIGILPFSKVALSSDYKVTYIAGMMDAMQGKTTFKLKITDHEGNPQSGLAPVLMPMMNMATHRHSTPVGSVTEDEVAGTYHATVYFLMASQMDSGRSMGFWDLKIMIGDQYVHFFPPVMMAMGDSPLAKLKGQSDLIPDMTSDSGSASRTYDLFNAGLMATDDGHAFSVFISAKESMMSFPALVQGSTLNEGSDFELTVNSVDVQMSTDEVTWVTASNQGGGIWKANGLSDLAAGIEAEIYVNLTVNDELKTDDGDVGDSASAEAVFMVTAQMMPM